MVTLLISMLLGYLLGSIPFGLVLTRLAGLGDIRKIGSGNIGATNVLRTGRKDLAALTVLFDSGKAALAALIAFWIFDSEPAGFAAGTAAVLGHNFPIWLHFKGGKGVASTLGMMLVLTPTVGITTCLTWLVTALVSRYSSLAALTALCLAPLYALLWASPDAAWSYLFLALLSLWRHKGNINRLYHGQESRIRLHK